MSTICREFEKEEAEEGEESQRQERILQLMQQVNWLFCCEVKFCTQFHSISYANLFIAFLFYIYWIQKIIKLNLIFSFIICSYRIVGSHLMILVVVLYRLLYCLLVYYSLLMNSAILCELCVLIKIWLQFFTLRDNIIICCVNLKSASYNVFTACVVQLESTCCVKISVVHVCTFHGKMVKSRHIRTSCFGMII